MGFEQLEDRRLLAVVTPVLDSGDVVLNGDAAVDLALASWTSGNSAAAMIDLGALFEDGHKDDLKGDRGDDELVGSAYDKMKF